MDRPALAQPAPQTYRNVEAVVLRGGQVQPQQDCVAEEVPVALEYNGISHAVMMATPADLEDFAYGFSLSEGIVDSASQIHGVDVVTGTQGVTVQVEIASSCFMRLKEMRRNLTGRTGCGLCGTESLDHAVRQPQPLQTRPRFAAPAVARAMAAMREQQGLLSLTGATHAAAWCEADGSIKLLREDVGRHNALDKLIGALRRGKLPAEDGFVAVTSRASYEMVQKTASAGIGLLCAVSGVTALAVQVADTAKLTLVGFARGENLSVYAHADQFNWK